MMRDEVVRLGTVTLRYRVAGVGPTLLHVNQDRPRRLLHLRGLVDICRVVQIDPIGFGRSDRPLTERAIPPLTDQVAAVLDVERVRDCVGWGYSQGAAMTALAASADSRFSGAIYGGSTVAHQMTEAEYRRVQQGASVPIASKHFWKQFMAIDWETELKAASMPTLLYLGALDQRRVSKLERHSEIYSSRLMTTVILEDVDHRQCNEDPALTARVIPLVRSWLQEIAA